ncbi:hypothetical protein TWF696_004355 [Orbilia brochopaga]
MEDYIVNCRRVVTPIYPGDAAAIVQTLDIHVSPEVDPVNGPLEILEAGTGHGSLTLHLARAIFAGYAGKDQPAAIVHSVEHNELYSRCAQEMFSKFRRGQYTGSGVKFYVNTVETWLRNEIKTRKQARQTHNPTADTPAAVEEEANSESEDQPGQDTNTTSSDETGSSAPKASAHSKDLPFLSACVLDLPDPRPILPLLMRALRLDAVLGYWAPSITQVVNVVEHIRIRKLPFFVDKVLEFSNGAGASGARLWDVRVAKVRSRERGREAASPLSKVPSADFSERFLVKGDKAKDPKIPGEASATEAPASPTTGKGSEEDLSDFEVVCRPKVGEKTQGGGFYLVLRRVGHHREVPLEETSQDDQPASESSDVTESSDLPSLTDRDRRFLEGLSSGQNILLDAERRHLAHSPDNDTSQRHEGFLKWMGYSGSESKSDSQFDSPQSESDSTEGFILRRLRQISEQKPKAQVQEVIEKDGESGSSDEPAMLELLRLQRSILLKAQSKAARKAQGQDDAE